MILLLILLFTLLLILLFIKPPHPSSPPPRPPAGGHLPQMDTYPRPRRSCLRASSPPPNPLFPHSPPLAPCPGESPPLPYPAAGGPPRRLTPLILRRQLGEHACRSAMDWTPHSLGRRRLVLLQGRRQGGRRRAGAAASRCEWSCGMGALRCRGIWHGCLWECSWMLMVDNMVAFYHTLLQQPPPARLCLSSTKLFCPMHALYHCVFVVAAVPASPTLWLWPGSEGWV